MGFIYDDRLEKDAKQILLYGKEEKRVLEDICTKLINISNSYSSPNSTKYIKLSQRFKNNIQVIYEKREGYAMILYNKIIQSKELSQKIVKKFEEVGKQ